MLSKREFLEKERLFLFQKDLQHGLSISEACSKYNISFKDAFNKMNKPNKPKQHHCGTTPAMYIHHRKTSTGDDTFAIRKTVNNRTRMFGVYSSLEDAVTIRDALIERGWLQRSVDKLCMEFGIVRRINPQKDKVQYS